MEEFSTDRRTVLRGIAGAGAVAALPTATAAADTAGTTDPTTRATFEAVVDAVIPETPELADELGPEHEPGGVETGLHDYLITYTNTLFSLFDVPDLTVGVELEQVVDPPEDFEIDISESVSLDENPALNIRLAEVVAATCDVAAVELLARAENEDTPDPTRYEAGRTFAALSRGDRLRALALLDEKEIDTAELPGPVLEGTAALIPQLVVAFPQVIYYSEWEGYEDITEPPSTREFDEEGIQGWTQTDFPGVIDGSASFRGFWGAPDSPLGTGAVWKSFEDDSAGSEEDAPGPPESILDGVPGNPETPGNPDPGSPTDGGGDSEEGSTPRIYLAPGHFEEDDYDTSGYEEPFDTSGEPAGGFETGEMNVQRPEDAIDGVREEVDEGLLGRAADRFFGADITEGGAD